MGALRVKEPALLSGVIPALLNSTLSALLLGLLSLREPTDLGDTNFDAKRRGEFFQGAIAGKVKLFD